VKQKACREKEKLASGERRTGARRFRFSMPPPCESILVIVINPRGDSGTSVVRYEQKR
jgi:hypothetical protein